MGFAARLGDPTMHGGTIIVGCPTVLIGGMPAARIGDMHVCPMVTPGVPPIPHVGGPIILGSPMVLIGGMPAARMNDMITCVGPPDSIMMGCPTVLIGEGGSGSASGGGAAGSGAANAVASASNALNDNSETTTQEGEWIEFKFTDKAGNIISGVPYKFTDTDNNNSENILRLDGKVRRDMLNKGNCGVELRNISGAKWAKDKIKIGDKVGLSVESTGLKNGEEVSFTIVKRDLSGADSVIGNVAGKIQGDKAKAEWEFKNSAGSENSNDSENENSSGKYSYPRYYFVANSGPHLRAYSDMLEVEDFIEFELKDENGKPLANEEYILYLTNGQIRKGKLDGNGYKKEEKLPSGACSIKFPKLNKIIEQ